MVISSSLTGSVTACMYHVSHVYMLLCHLLLLSLSSPATEKGSSSPIRGKRGKREPDTAAMKRRKKRRGRKNIFKSKKMKQSKSVHKPIANKKGKRQGSYHREEDSAFSDQSSVSSDEGQSSTSSELGKH